LYRDGIELLGSKVGFLLVLLVTPPILFGSVIYNAQIVKAQKFHLYQKNKKRR
jgi:hypothetical protein